MWESSEDMQPGIDDQLLINEGELNELNEPLHCNDFCNISHCDVNKIPYHRGMVMASLNINSLIAHIDELRVYININKIDIMCINETKLDSSVKDHEVCLPGYEIIRRDRSKNGRNGGGICIYVRSNINYKIRDDLQLEALENLVLEIKKPRSKPILISTWYRPPDSPVSHFTEFEQMIGSFDAENLEYYLLGDLNVDFMPTSESSNRQKVKEILDIYEIEQLINEPTRITATSSTLIDLCLTNKPANIVKSGVLHLSISDHSLVYMIRKAHHTPQGPRIINTRSMKNFNREAFLNDLKQKEWQSVYFSQDPNEMWHTWKNMLMQIIDKHAPLRSRRIRNRKSPWITNELRHQMFHRDYLKKKAISSMDPVIWNKYRQTKNYINNEIKKSKQAYYKNNLELNKGNLKKSWKIVNELSSRNACKTNRIAQLKVEGQEMSTPREIAETFNSYFSNIGEKLASEIPPSEHEPSFYLTPTDKSFSLQAPQVDTVYQLLSRIDERKSEGLDNIPNKLLKVAAAVVAPSLTGIFAASIRTGIFPYEWKASRVTPIFKSGTRSDPGNYRPISVIPCVAKIFEKIIFDQLYEYLDGNNLLTTCQSGFRSFHSTLTALLEATCDWSINIDNGLVNGVVFIDLKKAFDTIDHQIILLKLKNYGIDENSLTWFDSYLTDRTQKCRVNDELSNSVPVTCGVPQGSSLGPLLFLIYINDLPNSLNYATPRMFADDTSVSYASNSAEELRNVINSELKSLNKWLITNKLSLNIMKTEFMIIGSRQRIRNLNDEIDIELNGKIINKIDSVKSLGLAIDSHLTWSVHIDNLCKKIASAIGSLKRIISYIPMSTAIQIYHALIQPHFDYCCSVWDELGETLSTKLQKLQNRAARVITRTTYDTNAGMLLDTLHLDNLSLRRKKLKIGLVFKTLKGNTPTYLQSFFSSRSSEYELRNSEMKLNLPKPRTNYLKRSFHYSGALLWNSLPENIRKLQSFTQFRKAVNEYYNTLSELPHGNLVNQ